jgi:hypothetical protein
MSPLSNWGSVVAAPGARKYVARRERATRWLVSLDLAAHRSHQLSPTDRPRCRASKR